MKRFSILIVMLCASTFALAQKADVAVTVGGSFVSDSQQTFSTGPSSITKLKTDNHIFLEGTLGVRMLNARIAALYVELPVAGLPSQKLTFSTSPSTVLDHISTVFITPSLKLKILPVSPISPWLSLGGGWARYSLDSGTTSSKAAVQYGGGLDFKSGLPILGFRAEVRDFVTGDPNFGLGSAISGSNSGLKHHNVLAGGGIVLRF